MKARFTLILCTILLGLSFQLFAQTRSIYTHPDFISLAQDHKVLAIIPFKATVKLRPNQMKKYTPEQYEEMQKIEGKAIQSAVHSYFLKKKSKNPFTVSFQDIQKTNALLGKNEITQDNIENYTPEELAEILGVDGVISGTMNTDKPMSEGASMALGMVFGFYGSTNSGKITIHINDGESGELLWKYEKNLSRSLGSDTNTVINAMMRKASRKLPYLRM
ncbi:hypothetical protein [Xanthovirga aplysinae]|uniref:hypothetical protein n=1 Tax=Xanthovirga aplysinae TaxID=2529853 RepID=UPI0012BC35B0|nr:hypothetical protein [Xanthovirga aplysinae]MTI33251.1 hypothetical protein [Xanthovirga aplysinae]